jgi:hypothetical protein
MLIVPLQATPSQSVQVTLANQNVALNVYQKSTGLFMDIYLGGALLIGGVICQNLNRIIRSLYFGFIGDFAWVDVQGTTDANGVSLGSDPVYTGIGSQYFLAYLNAADLPAGEG